MKTLLFAFVCLIYSFGSQYSYQFYNDKIELAGLKTYNPDTIIKDITIDFILYGISSEGASVQATYNNFNIEKINITLYGELGKINIVYQFEKNEIDVVENQIMYLTTKDKDENQIRYSIDRNGHLINKKTDFNYTNIFNKIKTNIPFILR